MSASTCFRFIQKLTFLLKKPSFYLIYPSKRFTEGDIKSILAIRSHSIVNAQIGIFSLVH